MYIDFHTHLDWYENQELLISQLVESGIYCIAASVDEESYKKNCEIAEKVNELAGKEQIIPTFGIHPCKVPEYINEKSTENTQRQKFKEYNSDVDSKLAGLIPLMDKSSLIGEIGMDFCWYKEASPVAQEKIFRFFLDYCNKTRKYCVIHTKDAEAQIEHILLDYPDAKPIIHWYDGPEDIYREFINRGYLFTFGCETCRSSHIQKLLKMTPITQILCETDNPTAEPWLGGTDSSPMLIKRVYKDVVDVLGVDMEILKHQGQVYLSQFRNTWTCPR